jgi:hypothetical protein
MKRNLWLLLVLFAGIVIAFGILRSRATQIGIGAEPEIISFTATPSVSQPGQPVILAWKARGTPSLTLDWATKDHPAASMPERAKLAASGTMKVEPVKDTVYTLTCETAGGPMCSTSVTVETKNSGENR